MNTLPKKYDLIEWKGTIWKMIFIVLEDAKELDSEHVPDDDYCMYTFPLIYIVYSTHGSIQLVQTDILFSENELNTLRKLG